MNRFGSNSLQTFLDRIKTEPPVVAVSKSK